MENKLHLFQNKIMKLSDTIVHEIDQFGYINIFIAKIQNKYQLIASSETFDLSKLLNFK